MAPQKVQISQEAFDALVKENVDEFEMELCEALEDAIKTFQMQGVDLTGIVIDGSGGGNGNLVHPVVEAVKTLQTALDHVNSENAKSPLNSPEPGANASDKPIAEVLKALDSLRVKCSDGELDHALIAGKNGGVEATISAYQAVKSQGALAAGVAMEALLSLLADDHNRERFQQADGPQIVLEALAMEDESKVAEYGAAAVAAAATKNENLKDTFMYLGADDLLINLLRKHATDVAVLQVTCDAIRSLVTADDERPAASKAFRHAMRIAKAGGVDSILAVFRQLPKSSALLPTLCITLKSLAVNDDICKGIAEQGGLDMVLQFLDHAILHHDRAMARSACSLLSQLAGSDTNKDGIVLRGGMNQIIMLMSNYSEDPSVLQEGFVAMATLTLRSPNNASKAVQAGAVDMAAEMMEMHAGVAPMLRQACQMLRNLAVRNPENRPIIMERGLPALIRKAKTTHAICQDVGSAALRDLGFDDYK